MQYIITHESAFLNIDTEEFIASLPPWIHSDSIAPQNLSQHLEAVAAELCDYINDTNREQLIDMLRDEYPTDPDCTGQFDLDEIRNSFIKMTLERIAASYAHATIVLEIYTDDGTTASRVISLAELLTDELSELSSEGDFDSVLAAYVESCLNAYVDNSVWNCGYLLSNGSYLVNSVALQNLGDDSRGTFALWFGPKAAQPLSKWTIRSDAPIPPAWFESQTWETLQYLIDNSDDCFLTWYTAECCLWAPDLPQIRETCPVLFSCDDDEQTVRRKMLEYAQHLAVEDD